MRTREAILSATLELIAEGGFPAATVTAVAARAGVSRQTVHTAFGSREALVSQAVQAAALDALAAIEAELAPLTSATAYLVEFFVLARRAVRGHPALAALLRPDANPLFDRGMMGQAEPVAGALLGGVRERSTRLADDDAYADLLELAIRLGVTVVLFDSARTASDDGLRAFLRRWLDPVLGR